MSSDHQADEFGWRTEGHGQRMIYPPPGRCMAAKAGPLDKRVENRIPLLVASYTGHHRELRCVEHLSKYKQCPNTPETAQKRDYGNLQQSTVSFRPFPPECRSNSRGVAGDDEMTAFPAMWEGPGFVYDKSGARAVDASVDRELAEEPNILGGETSIYGRQAVEFGMRRPQHITD
jgi:hypothetical protein